MQSLRNLVWGQRTLSPVVACLITAVLLFPASFTAHATETAGWQLQVLSGSTESCGGDDAVWTLLRDGVPASDDVQNNIVWGDFADSDNIVWGNAADGEGDNIVWGNRFEGEGDNIVWGNGFESDNIVWGNSAEGDNIVWGNILDSDVIVWRVSCGDNIVWGNLAQIQPASDEGR